MVKVIQATELFKTINDFICDSGGAKMLTDLIISENHEIYEGEAVRADYRLKKKGIISYKDIKPCREFHAHAYTSNAIKYMYPHHSYAEMSEQLNRPLNYVIHSVNLLINSGEIKRVKPFYPIWTAKEMSFLTKNASTMNSSDLAVVLGRTKHAVSKRKMLMHLTMEEKYKKPSGRLAYRTHI